MKRVVWPTAGLLVVAVLSAGLSAVSGLALWWAFLVVAGALLINGWVATLEDDLPGGFNNPDGKHTPRYAVVAGWIIRGLGVALAVMIAGALVIHFFGAR